MTLYEIDARIAGCIDDESGEILDIDQLEQLEVDRQAKIENVALWIKNAKATAQAIRAEEKALTERRRAMENSVARCEQYLAQSLSGEKFQTARVSVSYRKSKVLEMESERDAVDFLARSGRDDLLDYAQPKVSKSRLKNAIAESEIEVPGVRIAERQNLQIK